MMACKVGPLVAHLTARLGQEQDKKVLELWLSDVKGNPSPGAMATLGATVISGDATLEVSFVLGDPASGHYVAAAPFLKVDDSLSCVVFITTEGALQAFSWNDFRVGDHCQG